MKINELELPLRVTSNHYVPCNGTYEPLNIFLKKDHKKPGAGNTATMAVCKELPTSHEGALKSHIPNTGLRMLSGQKLELVT